MAIPISELQSINPSSIIELFKLELIEGIHYATGNPDSVTTVYRFHSGTSLKTNNAIVWAGDTYDRYPVECAGFELSGEGAIARPQMRISNVLSLFILVIVPQPCSPKNSYLTRSPILNCGFLNFCCIYFGNFCFFIIQLFQHLIFQLKTISIHLFVKLHHVQ